MLYNSVVISNNTMHINYTKFSNEELDGIKIEFDALDTPLMMLMTSALKGWKKEAEE